MLRHPLLAATGLVLLAACGPRHSSDLPSRPNLILVTLDTVRADRLGCYGRTGAGTPTFDRLAHEGAVVEQAIAVAPLTLPSHASILTGLYPPRHGIRDNADFRLPENETTLAEHLEAQGYATAASVGARVLAGSLGLAQGFDTYTEPLARGSAAETKRTTGIGFVEIAERRAEPVVDDAIAALDRIREGPFFLWVHLFDPHSDYDPPEPHRSAFPDDLYQGEIAYTDAQIGRLVAQLERHGLADRTLVVVTADHGESLGEHGESTHGLFVYDAVIRVPLLIRYPAAIPAGSRYPGLVSGVDLVPTILDLMALPALPGVQGVSHAAALRKKAPPPSREPVYAESLYPERTYGWAPPRALRSSKDKFIEAPEPEFYDLVADPGETDNLAARRPSGVLDGKRRLLAALQGFGEPDASARSPMDAEQRAALESLGYVAAPGSNRARSTPPPDPKKLVAVHDKYLLARSLVASGDLARVRRLVGEILGLDPENPGAIALRGTVAFEEGEESRGIDELRYAAERSPTVFENWRNLATALHRAGRIDEAVSAYRSAIALQPANGSAWHGLGNALLAHGDPRGAVAAFDRAMKAGTGPPTLLASLGAALDAAGEPSRAEQALEEAVRRDGSLAEAWNKLGVLAEKSGRRPKAKERYDRALGANPRLADALFNRGKLALIERRFDDAARDAGALTDAHPDYAAGWFLRGQAAAARGDSAGARSALERYLTSPMPDPRLAAAARDLLAQIGS